MDALLALLRNLLGDEHPALAPLADAEPNPDATVDGATDDQLEAIRSLANVTDAAIADVVQALRDLGRSDDTPTDDVIAAADLVKGFGFVQEVRAEAAAAEAEARAEALAALGGDDDTTDDTDTESDEVEEVDTTDEVEQTADADSRETVAASRPRISNVAPRMPKPAKPLPTVEAQENAAAKVALRLVDGIGGKFERGQIANGDDLVQALAGKFAQFGGPATGFEKHPVASAHWLDQYPEEQRLGGDLNTNLARIQAAVGNYGTLAPDVLTASVCAPPTPIYDIVTIGSEARPVKDFLDSFGATRGGVVFRPGFSLSTGGTIGADSSGISVDWSDGDTNKYVRQIACPDTETATVTAQVARAEVSNMQSQFDPESVAAALRIQMVLWARAAETNLLDQIDAASGQIGADNAAVVGFSRLLLERFNNAATLIRSQERMDREATLDLLLPAWVINAFMDDMSFQAPGDGLATFEATAAVIERFLAARNIRVGWFLDDQLMPTQTVPSADLAGYPQQVQGYIFDPGHHLFLDGGELNLGIVRDSTLNNTNEYQTFMETFEAVASRGVVSWEVNINVCRSGTSGAPAEIACGEIS